MGLTTEKPRTQNSVWRWGEATGTFPLHRLAKGLDKYISNPAMESCEWAHEWSLKEISKSTIEILPWGLVAKVWYLIACLSPPANDCRAMSEYENNCMNKKVWKKTTNIKNPSLHLPLFLDASGFLLHRSASQRCVLTPDKIASNCTRVKKLLCSCLETLAAWPTLIAKD